jgi:hypothetical protein
VTLYTSPTVLVVGNALNSQEPYTLYTLDTLVSTSDLVYVSDLSALVFNEALVRVSYRVISLISLFSAAVALVVSASTASSLAVASASILAYNSASLLTALVFSSAIWLSKLFSAFNALFFSLLTIASI